MHKLPFDCVVNVSFAVLICVQITHFVVIVIDLNRVGHLVLFVCLFSAGPFMDP